MFHLHVRVRACMRACLHARVMHTTSLKYIKYSSCNLPDDGLFRTKTCLGMQDVK
jgi:hypothetical protein